MISSYSQIHTLGHKFLADLFCGPVVIQEKIDGCVTPDTLILCEDLVYRRAGDLRKGDKLVGVTESTNDPRLCESKVTVSVPILKQCVEIRTENRRVVASVDHPWLVKGKSNNAKIWKESVLLTPGDEIIALPVWATDTSNSAGYLAGILDGEGTAGRYGKVRRLAVYQKVGDVLSRVKSLLSSCGFKYNLDVRQRKPEHSQIGCLLLLGGWTEILRLLGSVRPIRLLATAKSIWNGAPMNSIPHEKVISIRNAGVQTVVGLSTSSKTYVAEGMLCHNSQFAFGVINGVLHCRSKGQQIQLDAAGMFAAAVATARRLFDSAKLGGSGVIYRCEYLSKPKHNSLTYGRVPKGNLVLFDIDYPGQYYISSGVLRSEAENLGLEPVPVLFSGEVTKLQQQWLEHDLLSRESVLGGCKIEGAVIKNYNRFGSDGKILVGKFVSPAFKEVHRHEWRKDNPTKSDIVQQIIADYKTSPRWYKGRQHLRERGELVNAPQDIGKLILEVQADVKREEIDAIKETLFKHFWPQISRGIISGLPLWYKNLLLTDETNPTDKE